MRLRSPAEGCRLLSELGFSFTETARMDEPTVKVTSLGLFIVDTFEYNDKDGNKVGRPLFLPHLQPAHPLNPAAPGQ